MTFTLNTQPIQRARVVVPRHGLWSAEVAVAGPLQIAEGDTVELLLGDQPFRGSVVAGDTFVDEARYTLTAGRGWARTVKAKSYSVPGGVSLATVAQELAREAGEQIDVAGSTRVLGDHWTRPAGPASVALSALFPLDEGGWRVDPDGVARPGVRPPAPLPQGLELVLEDYQPDQRRARVSLPGDRLSALLPGSVLTAPTLRAPLVVGEAVFVATPDAVEAHLLGEGGAVELFAALVAALTPSRTFGGVWTYQAADVDTGRPNLRALASVAGLPDVLACDKVAGLPGASSTLQAGALVLVAFRDGNPARPAVVGYLPGVLPDAVGIDARTAIELGTHGSVGAVARAQPLALNLVALRTAVLQLGGTCGPMLDTSAEKVMVE